jgi:hypothetical protein
LTSPACPGPPGGDEAVAAPRLTWREWQEVARASAAFCLLEGGLGGFRGFLLRQVGASSPLGAKLARLARLYIGVSSGRRCCP